ncbi:hypothetical protein A6A08_16715 [Nocardiopsis sp. TSRI0078]|uniref:hypothetical protein n=1 Tax=unclassified Nocardiopsis TaxID=2649073 RepID=UPI00093EFBD0|nr:hypothetical protein [Nocardiopsis sp. TSRI0078]OKI13077.1 hypothetical protein A6A08_16715 [Nocardiopsis sp. TSRI0078]
MDVTGWLLRRAVPCAFVVTAIGGTGARLAVERAVRERGWRQALAPAEADLLVVCGPADPELDEMLDRVWGQMPGPRARAGVPSPEGADEALDRARADLLDTAAQRRDADGRDRAARERAGAGDDEHMPGGLAMADRGEDRDGLALDRLHLALGPALPDWPAGLSLRTVLQGDVVQEARVHLVGAREGSSFWTAPRNTPRTADPSPEHPRTTAAAALDAAQRLLFVAGWPAAALAGRRLRDALLEPEAGPGLGAELRRWARGVRRSRLLRWATDGLGAVGDRAPEELRGDATDRWSRWLDRIEAAAEPGRSASAPAPAGSGTARAALDLVPELVVGRELAAARLIVASLDPDTEAVGAHTPERGA